MKESIFRSAIRMFFLTLFGVAGILIGLILILSLFGLSGGVTDGEPEIKYNYGLQIQPNAEGVRKSLSNDAPVILQLNINGIIGLDHMTHDDIQQQLIESRERELKGDRVKAILLVINSPGGGVNDADGIYRSIKAYKEKWSIPVYAYVDGLCASGGMYIAAAADKIYASEASLIGSVGVLMPTAFNFTQLMEKVGVQSLTIYDGKGKDNLNPFRPWQKGEEHNIKDAIDFYYDVFVNILVNQRHMDKTKLVEEYGANVYPAPKAKELGYIDVSGASLQDTMKELAQQIGIEDTYYQVISMSKKTWVSELFNTEMGLLTGKVTHQIALPMEIDPKLNNQYLYLYRP